MLERSFHFDLKLTNDCRFQSIIRINVSFSLFHPSMRDKSKRIDSYLVDGVFSSISEIEGAFLIVN